jgi:photosystem II stability/assembly factor-like uncharacterized protein
MKIKFTLTAIFFVFIINVNAQKWKPTGALAATNSYYYLTGATSVGNDIFAVNYDKTMVYSTDLGVTWSAPAASKLKGSYAYLLGIENRLYASMKINTYDTELQYSTDRGATWKPDTVGLPLSITKTGKAAMLIKYMENGYMLAHNNLVAFYKKVDETKWKPTSIDFIIVDVAATKDTWIAIGGAKILQSKNNGGTWTQMSPTGLPANFQGNKICSNGKRLYMSNAPANGGEDIYYSDNGGSSWTKTNSAGKYNFKNPWVQYMYAVEDYLFAAILPEKVQDAPPFAVSSTKEPNFSVGDVSGLITGKTTTSLPFFFHVKNKLFTMMWDLYSSEPGFKGESNPSTGIEFVEIENQSVSIYPNPASQTIQIEAGNYDISNIEIFNLRGQKVFQQNTPLLHPIDISKWGNGFYIVKLTSTNGQTAQSKFIKTQLQ